MCRRVIFVSFDFGCKGTTKIAQMQEKGQKKRADGTTDAANTP